MAYVAITDAQIDPESPITTGLMTQYRDNIAALKDGTGFDAGAVGSTALASSAVTEAKIGSGAVTEAKMGPGAVTEAKIGSGAVSRTKLKTTAAAGAAGTLTEGSSVNITMDAYSFFPMVHTSRLLTYMVGALTAGTADQPRFRLTYPDDQGSLIDSDYEVYWRYVTA